VKEVPSPAVPAASSPTTRKVNSCARAPNTVFRFAHLVEIIRVSGWLSRVSGVGSVSQVGRVSRARRVSRVSRFSRVSGSLAHHRCREGDLRRPCQSTSLHACLAHLHIVSVIRLAGTA
jgi:hypothetical protein